MEDSKGIDFVHKSRHIFMREASDLCSCVQDTDGCSVHPHSCYDVRGWALVNYLLRLGYTHVIRCDVNCLINSGSDRSPAMAMKSGKTANQYEILLC